MYPVADDARDGAEEDTVREFRDRCVCERGAEPLRGEALEGGRPAAEGGEDVEPAQLLRADVADHRRPARRADACGLVW